jgi:hypothetical protein
MKPILCISALLALFTAPLTAQSAAKPAPEIKPLQQFEGEWQNEYTVFQAEWTPEEKKGTGTSKATSVLAGNFIEEKNANSDNSTSQKLYTWDAQTKQYRAWWFSSGSHFNDATGVWDATAHTFTWTTKLANGVTGTTTQHFTDAKTMVWKIAFKDADGKVYYRSEGKCTRK